MFVSICAYCGKVNQIGRGFNSGGKTYCCQAHAGRDANYTTQAQGTPGEQITKRKHGGGGYWELEDGGLWELEDSGFWELEDYK